MFARRAAFAGLAMLLSATLLINAGSRFPHLFVAGIFVWSIEALFAIAAKGLARDEQVRWGAILGLCSSMMLAARPSDGATLGIGLFFYFVYAAARGRIGWRSVVAAALPFAVVSGVTLIVLRMQIGTWFSTGYSLAEGIRSWAAPSTACRNRNEFKFGIPIATGSYCWWPLSPAVGLMGVCGSEAARVASPSFLSLASCR